MYYHASPLGNISRLEPRISNHGIPLIYFSRKRENVPVDVADPELIADAYKEILEAEKQGLITIIRYEDQTDKKKDWIARTIKQEYEDAGKHPEYRYFFKGKIPILAKENGWI